MVTTIPRLQEVPGICPVELLYGNVPHLDLAQLAAVLRTHLPYARLVRDGAGQDAPVLVEHPNHPVQIGDAALPAATAILASDHVPDARLLAGALEHNWDWPDAPQVVERVSASVLVTELPARPPAPRARLALIEGVVRSVLDLAMPLAMHWTSAAKLVDPLAWRQRRGGAGAAPLPAYVNVRIFRLEGTEGDLVMDTLGLATLGLPDLQCRFRGLEPGRTGGWLYGVAGYLVERGDVIKDGHTVEGVEPGQRWKCRRETALLGPEREVLDINPGPRFAAGKRRG